MTTYNKPVDDTVAAIMNATKPFTKSELEKLFAVLYNEAYDEGFAVGDQHGYVDGFRDGQGDDGP